MDSIRSWSSPKKHQLSRGTTGSRTGGRAGAKSRTKLAVVSPVPIDRSYFSLLPKDILIYHAQFLEPLQLNSLSAIPEYASIIADTNGYLYRFYWYIYCLQDYNQKTSQDPINYCKEHGYASIGHAVIHREQIAKDIARDMIKLAICGLIILLLIFVVVCLLIYAFVRIFI